MMGDAQAASAASWASAMRASPEPLVQQHDPEFAPVGRPPVAASAAGRPATAPGGAAVVLEEQARPSTARRR
jgi:hypothetical protein